MPAPPIIRTARLVLRPFAPDDAAALSELAGAFEIADTTISIPHPYPLQVAVDWISGRGREPHGGGAVSFAIDEAVSGRLAGCVELRDIDAEHAQAELGFWIGKPFWRRGYASEAGKAVVRFAFESLGLNRIYAFHMARNPASGRVLLNLGLQREGVLRQRVRKWGRFEDVVSYAVLRSDAIPG
ncbi:MAG TPA: GNAT family N-acetyltransferase [Burkholderiales bacterium]|nr:GNAT family N-acetyltransferase [Burkholderiales bacterium]